MENVHQAWLTYAATKDPALKKEFIMEYAVLVKYVASRLTMYMGTNIEFDDLISYGIFGLIDAIDKFDVDKGVKFETYASQRIRGAIIDQIRKMSWAPRAVREKNKKLRQAFYELENEMGREPSDEELAAKLGLTIAETNELLSKSSALSLISLDGYLEQNHEEGASISTLHGEALQTPEDSVEASEVKRMLSDAIDLLNEQERKVITLYYFEQLTVKEIADVLSVSESRISQVHTKALLRLQSKLGKYRSLLFEK